MKHVFLKFSCFFYDPTNACMISCFSNVRLFVTVWTVAHQAPLCMEFSGQKYWSGVLFPSPGDLPDPGIKPMSHALQAELKLNEKRTKMGENREGWNQVPALTLSSPRACVKPGSLSRCTGWLLQQQGCSWGDAWAQTPSSLPQDCLLTRIVTC